MPKFLNFEPENIVSTEESQKKKITNCCWICEAPETYGFVLCFLGKGDLLNCSSCCMNYLSTTFFFLFFFNINFFHFYDEILFKSSARKICKHCCNVVVESKSKKENNICEFCQFFVFSQITRYLETFRTLGFDLNVCLNFMKS